MIRDKSRIDSNHNDNIYPRLFVRNRQEHQPLNLKSHPSESLIVVSAKHKSTLRSLSSICIPIQIEGLTCVAAHAIK